VPNAYLQPIQSARAKSHASTTIFQDRGGFFSIKRHVFLCEDAYLHADKHASLHQKIRLRNIVVLARLSAHTDWISNVFGAISSSSILCPILYRFYDYLCLPVEGWREVVELVATPGQQLVQRGGRELQVIVLAVPACYLPS